MGQPINAIVVWDGVSNQGTVGTITVPAGNGATVIRWTCDTAVIFVFHHHRTRLGSVQPGEVERQGDDLHDYRQLRGGET